MPFLFGIITNDVIFGFGVKSVNSLAISSVSTVSTLRSSFRYELDNKIGGVQMLH